MTNQSQPPSPPEQKSHGYQIGLTLFVAGLLFSFFLLGQSMVSHRFCSGGGHSNRYGHLTH